MDLPWDPRAHEYLRRDILRIARSEARSAAVQRIGDSRTLCSREIKAENFVAWIWVKRSESDDENNPVQLETNDGKVTVLNEGVFVCEDDMVQWLPPHLRSCDGVINFSARAVDLPVSRDKVIENRKASLRRDELASKSLGLIDELVATTAAEDEATADAAALSLALIFNRAEEDFKERIVRQLDKYRVRPWRRKRTLPLEEIRAGSRQ